MQPREALERGVMAFLGTMADPGLIGGNT